MRVAVVTAALGAWACAEPPQPAMPAVASAPAPEPADAAVDAAAPVASEVEARALVLARLRGAGLRILVDVPVALPAGEVTLDGYDPQRRIGFEYVAAGEAGTDLSAAERASLQRGEAGLVLVLDAAPVPAIAAEAEAFVASWARADAGM